MLGGLSVGCLGAHSVVMATLAFCYTSGLRYQLNLSKKNYNSCFIQSSLFASYSLLSRWDALSMLCLPHCHLCCATMLYLTVPECQDKISIYAYLLLHKEDSCRWWRLLVGDKQKSPGKAAKSKQKNNTKWMWKKLIWNKKRTWSKKNRKKLNSM